MGMGGKEESGKEKGGEKEKIREAPSRMKRISDKR